MWTVLCVPCRKANTWLEEHLLEKSDDDSDYSYQYSSGESDYGKDNPNATALNPEEPQVQFKDLSKADRDDKIFLLWQRLSSKLHGAINI